MVLHAMRSGSETARMESHYFKATCEAQAGHMLWCPRSWIDGPLDSSIPHSGAP